MPLAVAVENLNGMAAAMATAEGEARTYYQGQIDNYQRVIELYSLLDFEDQLPAAIAFTPVPGNLRDPEHMFPSERRQVAKSLAREDASHWLNASLSYIAEAQNKWYEATHQGFQGLSAERSDSVAQYNSLDEAIHAFFGVALGRDADGTATLFGMPIASAQLSSGQTMALQLIVALHAKGASLDQTIMIMDEPETHLHPDALVKLLQSIRFVAPDAQLWIATHSLPLLAYISATEVNAVWAVSDGVAQFAGRRPEVVIRELLGDEDSVAHLSAFIALPHHLASNNYAYQCLLPPKTVMTGSDDPQLEQIRTVLRGLGAESSIAILDYGAGKGRLIEAFQSMGEGDRTLDYVAYDPFDDDKAHCKSALSKIYNDVESRYFNSAEQLVDVRGERWAGCVVMTNVLHEVPVSEWVSLFSTRSVPFRVLKEGGYLLIVEDQLIPIGEMAHQHGFLLMNTAQLKKFFVVTEADVASGLFISHKDESGRLTAHLVSKELFGRVSSDSRRQAISAIRDLSLNKVTELRRAEKNYKNGLLHGLWTQQFANATLALEAC